VRGALLREPKLPGMPAPDGEPEVRGTTDRCVDPPGFDPPGLKELLGTRPAGALPGGVEIFGEETPGFVLGTRFDPSLPRGAVRLPPLKPPAPESILGPTRVVLERGGCVIPEDPRSRKVLPPGTLVFGVPRPGKPESAWSTPGKVRGVRVFGKLGFRVDGLPRDGMVGFPSVPPIPGREDPPPDRLKPEPLPTPRPVPLSTPSRMSRPRIAVLAGLLPSTVGPTTGSRPVVSRPTVLLPEVPRPPVAFPFVTLPSRPPSVKLSGVSVPGSVRPTELPSRPRPAPRPVALPTSVSPAGLPRLGPTMASPRPAPPLVASRPGPRPGWPTSDPPGCTPA